MIILFSFSLGLTIVINKKEQIRSIDKIIYIGEKILLMLVSTSPDTQFMLSEIESDKYLKNFDINSSCLKNEEKQKAYYIFDVLGKYDIDSQINSIKQTVGYFKQLREQYQSYYNSHYKLYLVFGLFGGILFSVLLI